MKYNILLNIGSGITGNDLTGSVSTLNNTFATAISYAGYVVIALAVIRIILAMSDQNPHAESQASLLLGGGIVMICFSSVLTALNIQDGTSGRQMVINALNVIGNGLTYVGVIILVFAIFRMIMSMATMRSEEAASASTLLAIGIACLSGTGLTKGINFALTYYSTSTTTLASSIVQYAAVNVIGRTATYIGAGILILGVYHLILGMREEDASSKMQAGIQIGVAIALLSAVAIITSVTGISTDSAILKYN